MPESKMRLPKRKKNTNEWIGRDTAASPYLSQRPCSSRDGRTHCRAIGTSPPGPLSSTDPSSSS